jgi:hypothetical protein
MAVIILRSKLGEASPTDLKLSVQDRTYDYLMTTITREVRVSAFLDRDAPQVEAEYAEIFVAEDCPYESRVMKVIPGSRVRKGIALPGPMYESEQLTVLVERSPRTTSKA